jgi:hypothetical protein
MRSTMKTKTNDDGSVLCPARHSDAALIDRLEGGRSHDYIGDQWLLPVRLADSLVWSCSFLLNVSPLRLLCVREAVRTQHAGKAVLLHLVFYNTF